MAFASPDLRPSEDLITQLEAVYPNIYAYVLKFDLGFMILLFHPETDKVVAVLLTNIEVNGLQIIEADVSDFILHLTQEKGQVDLDFKVTFKLSEGADHISHLTYNDVTMTLYQTRAIATCN
jgi:uncharacterized protein YjiK